MGFFFYLWPCFWWKLVSFPEQKPQAIATFLNQLITATIPQTTSFQVTGSRSRCAIKRQEHSWRRGAVHPQPRALLPAGSSGKRGFCKTCRRGAGRVHGAGCERGGGAERCEVMTPQGTVGRHGEAPTQTHRTWLTGSLVTSALVQHQGNHRSHSCSVSSPGRTGSRLPTQAAQPPIQGASFLGKMGFYGPADLPGQVWRSSGTAEPPQVSDGSPDIFPSISQYWRC